MAPTPITVASRVANVATRFLFTEALKQSSFSKHFIAEDLEAPPAPLLCFYFFKQNIYDHEGEFRHALAYYQKLRGTAPSPTPRATSSSSCTELLVAEDAAASHFELILLFDLGDSDRIDVEQIKRPPAHEVPEDRLPPAAGPEEAERPVPRQHLHQEHHPGGRRAEDLGVQADLPEQPGLPELEDRTAQPALAPPAGPVHDRADLAEAAGRPHRGDDGRGQGPGHDGGPDHGQLPRADHTRRPTSLSRWTSSRSTLDLEDVILLFDEYFVLETRRGWR